MKCLWPSWSDGRVGEWASFSKSLLSLHLRHSSSPSLPLLHLRHSSFSDPSVASPTSQFILQPFRHFTYVTAHSPTLPSFHPRHSSFFNPSVASPTSQLIPTLRTFHLRLRHFTYVTWRAAHVCFEDWRIESGYKLQFITCVLEIIFKNIIKTPNFYMKWSLRI